MTGHAHPNAGLALSVLHLGRGQGAELVALLPQDRVVDAQQHRGRLLRRRQGTDGVADQAGQGGRLDAFAAYFADHDRPTGPPRARSGRRNRRPPLLPLRPIAGGQLGSRGSPGVGVEAFPLAGCEPRALSFVEAGVVDGLGGPVGEILGQGQVVLLECAPGPGRDETRRPQKCAPSGQRPAYPRRDAPWFQVPAKLLGVVHIGRQQGGIGPGMGTPKARFGVPLGTTHAPWRALDDLAEIAVERFDFQGFASGDLNETLQGLDITS